MLLDKILVGIIVLSAGAAAGATGAVLFAPPREVQVVEVQTHEVRVAEPITMRIDGVPCTFGKIDGKVFWLCDQNKTTVRLEGVDG